MTATLPARQGDASDNDTLLLFGGVSLLIMGAGLLLSNRTVQRYIGGVDAGGMLAEVVPDVERYLRLRAM